MIGIKHLGSLSVVVALAACGESAYFATPDGQLPATASECRAAYDAARERGRAYRPVPTTEGGLIGAAIGRGLVSGGIENAYRQCLERVGAPAGAAPVESQAPTTRTVKRTRVPAQVSGACKEGHGVMQGGTGYCVGF